jgi:hypothetical protein
VVVIGEQAYFVGTIQADREVAQDEVLDARYDSWRISVKIAEVARDREDEERPLGVVVGKQNGKPVFSGNRPDHGNGIIGYILHGEPLGQTCRTTCPENPIGPSGRLLASSRPV